MRKIFRITCAILIAIFLSSIFSTADAKKENYTDKTYKFSEVQNVFISKVEYAENLKFDTEISEQIQVIAKKFENKIKRPILDEDSENLADVKITITISDWQNISTYVPEKIYYEGWERKRIRDKNGMWSEVTGGYKTSSFYFPGATRKIKPAHYVWDSYIEVNFEVYDVNTGKLIMSRNDKRKREEKNKQLAMFGRMCKSFFQDFSKKIK